MQQKIEDQFQLKYYRGSLYNVIFLEQFRKYLISMAITLCYALTIIHASIPRPMRNLKALKLLCLEWIISTHDGWKWIYSKYSNDFKMKISRKWKTAGKVMTIPRKNFHLLETITTVRKLIFYMLYFVIFQLHKVEWYHFQFFFLGYYYYFSNFRINVKYSPDRFQFIIFKWVHFVKQQKLLKLTLRCHLIIKVQLFCWGEALGKAIILF